MSAKVDRCRIRRCDVRIELTAGAEGGVSGRARDAAELSGRAGFSGVGKLFPICAPIMRTNAHL